MIKYIAAATLVLMAVLSTVYAGCDMMKEFKPEVEEIMGWAKARCDANPELTDDDLKKAGGCYSEKLKPAFASSKHGDTINAFVEKKLFGDPATKKVCKDKPTQDAIKKTAMKDIGMKKGMECKKEVEADCPKYKAAMGDFYKCVKA